MWQQIEWDQHNSGHAAKRNISDAEIEPAIRDGDGHTPNTLGRDGVQIIGVTHGGRHLRVVARLRQQGDIIRPITAWEIQ